jgi:hypothetical protein
MLFLSCTSSAELVHTYFSDGSPAQAVSPELSTYVPPASRTANDLWGHKNLFCASENVVTDYKIKAHIGIV